MASDDIKKQADDFKKQAEGFFSDLSKSSVAKQIAIGGITGFATGFATGKVGKAAALGVGTGLIIILVANNQGWIEINWSKMDKIKEAARQEFNKTKSHQTMANVQNFIKKNVFLVGSFVGGFFIGVAV